MTNEFVTKIDEIYKTSNNKYEDLFDFFTKNCFFEIYTSRLTLNTNTFRVRDFDNISEIKTKGDVKYPPKAPCQFSRIGKPFDTWFYVSDDMNTAIVEMFPNWSRKYENEGLINIVISTWKIMAHIDTVIIPDFMNLNHVSKSLELVEKYTDKLFWSYICEKFRTTTLDDVNIYEFTSSFANSIFFKAKQENKNIDAIFYPSVQYQTYSNVALKKSVVDDEKVELNKVIISSLYKTINEDGKVFYQLSQKTEKGIYDKLNDIIAF